MRPDFWFGVLIVAGGLAMMTYSAWPRREPLEFKTLAIWTGENGIGAVAWYDGSRTKEEIESTGSYVNLKLTQTFTIQGRPVDPTWAKSVMPR